MDLADMVEIINDLPLVKDGFLESEFITFGEVPKLEKLFRYESYQFNKVISCA